MRKAVTFAAVIGVFSASSPAQESPGQPEWLGQAQIVARMEGISVGEAIRRTRLQDRIADLNRRFETDPNYGGAWIDRKGATFRVNFGFKRGASAQAIDDPEIREASNVTEVNYSIREIQQERQRIAQVLKSNGQDASFSVLIKEQRIEVYPENAAAVQELISAGTLVPAPFVTVKSAPLIREPEATVEGAGLMNGSELLANGTTSNYRCVGGFVVSDGVRRGISTAGHCAKNTGDLKLHRGQPVGNRLGFVMYQDGLDVSWHNNSAHTYLPRVRTSSSTYYTVTGLGDLTPAPGTLACIILKDDRQVCAYVNRVTYFANNDGPYPTLDRDIADGGDSGGPWISGGTAFGIHSGDVIYDGLRYDFYTPTRSLPRMGINVVIGP